MLFFSPTLAQWSLVSFSPSGVSFPHPHSYLSQHTSLNRCNFTVQVLNVPLILEQLSLWSRYHFHSAHSQHKPVHGWDLCTWCSSQQWVCDAETAKRQLFMLYFLYFLFSLPLPPSFALFQSCSLSARGMGSQTRCCLIDGFRYFCVIQGKPSNL